MSPRESETVRVVALLEMIQAAKAIADRAHDLCDDPDTNHIWTADILEAMDHLDAAARARYEHAGGLRS